MTLESIEELAELAEEIKVTPIRNAKTKEIVDFGLYNAQSSRVHFMEGNDDPDINHLIEGRCRKVLKDAGYRFETVEETVILNGDDGSADYHGDMISFEKDSFTQNLIDAVIWHKKKGAQV
jgi:hypothetical protein